LKPELIKSSFFSEIRPVWYFKDAPPIRQMIAELQAITLNGDKDLEADRIDLLCESLIMETIIRESTSSVSHEEKIIRRVCASIRDSFCESYDFDEIALKNGMSPSTFRRYWKKIIGMPPGRYLIQMRLQEACRLLVETNLSVSEIAGRLNFRDRLYFSRVFRKRFHMTATDYRKRYQEDLELYMTRSVMPE
jgi:AraC-like DNA-binding protein